MSTNTKIQKNQESFEFQVRVLDSANYVHMRLLDLDHQ
jgi:hypothetical protein